MSNQVLTLSESELTVLLKEMAEIVNSYLSRRLFPSILLSGELGAGKTTLVREWLKYVGSKDLANSPTFALHNIYTWKNISIHHFDLYRIKEKSELEQTGFDEIWGYEGISFIEWWKIADDLIPKLGRIYLNIELPNLDQRTYSISYEGL